MALRVCVGLFGKVSLLKPHLLENVKPLLEVCGWEAMLLRNKVEACLFAAFA